MQDDDSLPERGAAPFACCDTPCGADLFQVAEAALFRLALRGVRDAGWPAPGPRPMPVECAAEIQSPVLGLFVLRCDASLADRLCAGHAPKGVEGLLKALLAKVSKRCGLNGRAPWRWRLRRAGPEAWPKREPDQARVIMVGPDAIELRFWSLYWNP